MQLAQKILIVTGAGSGIGRELTLALVKKQATVAAVDLNPATLQETKDLAGEQASQITTHVANIADPAAVRKVAQDILQQHRVIDGLINNAGIIQPFVTVNDLDDAAIKRVMDVNFFGTLNFIKAVLPQLLQRPEAHITNVSSMGGFLPVPGQSVYGASKAAVKLLTEGLYAELKTTPVRVTAVFPGAISTNITQNSGVNMPNLPKDAKAYSTTSAATAAQAILRGMEKNAVRVYIGKDSKMMNWLYRIHPTFATNLIAKQMRNLLKT